MKREYALAWSIIFTAGAVLQVVGVGRWVWIGWLCAFGVLEGIAAYRPKLKDTWSEFFWSWSGDQKWRRIQGLPLGLWLSWRFFAATPGGWAIDERTGHVVGPALMALILAVWLPGHFLYQGRQG